MYHHTKLLYSEWDSPSSILKYTLFFFHIISQGKKELQGDGWRRNNDVGSTSNRELRSTRKAL
jgi:hypothetical protein